jgi:hypothetical protein
VIYGGSDENHYGKKRLVCEKHQNNWVVRILGMWGTHV